MSASLEQKTEDVYKAADLQNLLDHLAWTDVLRPEMLRAKEAATSRLTAAVLGTASAGEMRAEQLAGIVYGIDIFVSTVERVLRKGVQAENFLREMGLNLEK